MKEAAVAVLGTGKLAGTSQGATYFLNPERAENGEHHDKMIGRYGSKTVGRHVATGPGFRADLPFDPLNLRMEPPGLPADLYGLEAARAPDVGSPLPGLPAPPSGFEGQTRQGRAGASVPEPALRPQDWPAESNPIVPPGLLDRQQAMAKILRGSPGPEASRNTADGMSPPGDRRPHNILGFGQRLPPGFREVQGPAVPMTLGPSYRSCYQAMADTLRNQAGD
jgi:hypothetical protein